MSNTLRSGKSIPQQGVTFVKFIFQRMQHYICNIQMGPKNTGILHYICKQSSFLQIELILITFEKIKTYKK